MTVHEIPLERRTLHGHFSRGLEPILTVGPGDSIAFSTFPGDPSGPSTIPPRGSRPKAKP